jgi:hypothetical protein
MYIEKIPRRDYGNVNPEVICNELNVGSRSVLEFLDMLLDNISSSTSSFDWEGLRQGLKYLNASPGELEAFVTGYILHCILSDNEDEDLG